MNRGSENERRSFRLRPPAARRCPIKRFLARFAPVKRREESEEYEREGRVMLAFACLPRRRARATLRECEG